MTLEMDPPTASVPALGSYASETDLVLTGKLISMRYLVSALRRRRAIWMWGAVVGLVLGTAFHIVVPRTYSAYATLYMAHAPGTDEAVGMGNDVALLNNLAVSRRAIALLKEPSLNPTKILGKAPGRSISDNVMVVTITGPSAAEAVRRVNAVTTAFLAFRAKQYNAQDDDIVKGLNGQIKSLQSQVDGLTTTINKNTDSTQLTQLVDQRSQEEGTIANLQQTQQQDRLDTLSIVQATRVLTSGTNINRSTVKLFAVDGLSGLGVGLALGMGLVVLQALASDRVRRRDDVASLVGAPVAVSAGPVRRVRWSMRGGQAVRATGFRPPPELKPVVRYLLNRVVNSGQRGLLIVAVDRAELPAVAMAAVAATLAKQGKRVVLSDLADTRDFKAMFGGTDKPIQKVRIGNQAVTLFSPGRELGPEDSRAAWELSPDRWSRSDYVLAVANVDLALGAAHLRYWNEVVVAVTAGGSNPQRISATAELLAASGITPVSSILFDADKDDDGSGLLSISARAEGALALQHASSTMDWG